jgi:hypothetical protein
MPTMMVSRRSVWLGVEFDTATTLVVECHQHLAKCSALDENQYAESHVQPRHYRTSVPFAETHDA